MIKSKPTEAHYVFTDEELTITIVVDIKDRQFSMWTGDNSKEFEFLCVDVDRANRIMALMLAATEHAKQVIKYGHGWENVTDTIKATVTTEIEIGSIRNESEELTEEHETNWLGVINSNPPHSDTAEQGV